MGFFSFLGRVLFASIFILSAWQIAYSFSGSTNSERMVGLQQKNAPKLALVKKHIAKIIGKNNFHIDAKTFIAASIFLKGLGGLLFVVGSSFGAYLLMYYLILTTPLMYDFYNYKAGKPEFFRVLAEFLQCMALVGALLFFLGMKNSITRRQPKKKVTKPKAA